VEENVHMMALNFHWPPGSWDHLTLGRFARIIEAAARLAKEQSATLNPPR
jgi:hypothetical protein